MKVKVKVGDEGRFLIRDHSMSREAGVPDPDESLAFYVYGRVISLEGHNVLICPWIPTDFKADQNTEWYSLVKGAVLGFRPLGKRDR